MVIKKLVLHKYKRFFLNNIETIEYLPNNNTQMIVSRNGSGKTSLLRQLNPLPADIKKDFNENGYKYIEIEHNNKLYIISSNFINNKHSFKVDGIELNNGGTKTVSTELCKEHFNIDSSTMDILYGVTNFTTMSLTERKYWLSKLSTVDYTYSVSVFNKLKTRHRDIIGQLKGLNTELAKLKCKDNTEEKIKEKKDFISLLYKINDNILLDIGSKQLFIKDYTDTLSNLKTIVNKYKELNITDTLEEVIIKRDNVSKDILEVDIILNKTLEELTNLEKAITINNNNIEKEYKDVNNKITSILNTLDIPIPVTLETSIDSIDILIDSMLPYIQNNILKLDEYADVRSIPTDEKKKLIENYNILKARYDSYLKEYKDIEEEKNNIRQTDEIDITCSNCNSVFKYSDSKYRISLYNKRLEKITKEINTLEITLKGITPKVISLNNYKDIHIHILDTILEMSNRLLDIKDLILYISNNVYNHTDTISTIVNRFTVYTNSVYKLKELNILYKTRDTLKLQLDATIDVNMENIKKNIDTNNKKVEKYTILKRQYTKTLEQLNDTISKIEFKNKVLDLIDKDVYTIHTIYKNNIEAIKQQVRLNSLKVIKEAIAEQELLLQEMLDINTKKEDIVKSIEDLTIREEVLKDMLTELSPTTGLIGKSINSFITILIEDINFIINKIWSYPIKLLPCDIDTKDLDYKFKVLVNDTDTIEDISRLSSSMQEIVNLAFKIILCKYLNLDVPLYLDEFGSTFDTTHRTTAYNIINTILGSEFKQLFIICHYESLYGSFKNADFNILDRDNVTIPEDVDSNSSLTIRYY